MFLNYTVKKQEKIRYQNITKKWVIIAIKKTIQNSFF